jgi:hypothetical protein
MLLGCWLGHLKEREHLEDLVIDGRIILRCLKEIGLEGV